MIVPDEEDFPEFPVIDGCEPLTYGSKLREARAILQDLTGKLVVDRSHDRARDCLNACVLLTDILDDQWIDSLPLSWEPERDS